MSIVVARCIGSAFAAELGTMQVSKQIDTLRVLGTDPVDYLVTPRVIGCCVVLPILTLICFTVGLASSALLADGVYGVSINIILESARRALNPWDIISAMIKLQVFGGIELFLLSAMLGVLQFLEVLKALGSLLFRQWCYLLFNESNPIYLIQGYDICHV
ncbi:hypothetical protein IFM89_038416 [Coptis chinensis]|uniref:Uncharacterized protein n=1 Tax=Coptis chinensis TaxID=261450 RepID=A0A835H9M4_9MAGN|nr:hypothetical protein IFM89_038416 [Coptis chinensis]